MEDLKEERETLASAINKKHLCETVYAESFVARTESPKEICLEAVRNCNIYIGIIKKRYGFIPETYNPSKLSVTEIEYNEARSKELPIFIFVDKSITERESKLNDFLIRLSNYETGHWIKEYSNVDELVNFALNSIEYEVYGHYINNRCFQIKSPIPFSADYERVLKIIEDIQSPENKTELKTIYYSTTDKIAQLQIILALADWYEPQEDNLDDLIGLCDKGIKITNEVIRKEEKAVLLAYKGFFISMQFLDIEEAEYSVKALNLTGISLITEEERQRINHLDILSKKCFKEAEKIAKEIKSYKALGFVYVQIGNAAGQRFIHLNHSDFNRAQQEKQLAKRAFMLAKENYSKLDDELQIVYVFHNLANQLRFFGENEEAKKLVSKVIEIGKKYNEQKLLKYAGILLQRIESGEIPD